MRSAHRTIDPFRVGEGERLFGIECRKQHQGSLEAERTAQLDFERGVPGESVRDQDS